MRRRAGFVVAIDHLDAVPASRGREILGSARSLFKHGFVVVIAADSARLAAPAGEHAPGLDTWIQVPFQIGELASRANYATLVGQISAVRRPRSHAAATPRYRRSTSRCPPPRRGCSPVWPRLRAVQPAPSNASSISIALTRVQDHVHKGALAFMLALDAGGTQAEIAAVNDALSHAQMGGDGA